MRRQSDRLVRAHLAQKSYTVVAAMVVVTDAAVLPFIATTVASKLAAAARGRSSGGHCAHMVQVRALG